MEFPKLTFGSKGPCFRTLFNWVHPEGLLCPNCHECDGLHVHENHRQPWRIRYRCSHCRHTFTAWTGTRLQGTHRPPSEILGIMKGMFQGKSSRQLAGELGRHRGSLDNLRHRLQPLVLSIFGHPPPEKSTESTKVENHQTRTLVGIRALPEQFHPFPYNLEKRFLPY